MKKIGFIKMLPLIAAASCGANTDSNSTADLEQRIHTQAEAFIDSSTVHLNQAQKYLDSSISYSDSADSVAALGQNPVSFQNLSNNSFDNFGRELYSSLKFGVDASLEYGKLELATQESVELAIDNLNDVKTNIDVFESANIPEQKIYDLLAASHLAYAMQLEKTMIQEGYNEGLKGQFDAALIKGREYLDRASESTIIDLTPKYNLLDQ